MAGNVRISKENIDEVILALLNLKSGDKLNYQTYAKILKKRLVRSRLIGQELPVEEDLLLYQELKRVRNLSGIFKIRIKKIKLSMPSRRGILKVNKINIRKKPPEFLAIAKLIQEFASKEAQKTSAIVKFDPKKALGRPEETLKPKTSAIVKFDPKKALGRPEETLKPKTSAIVKFDPKKALGRPDLSVKKVNVRDVTEKKPKKDSIYDILLRISKVLDSILKTITDSNKQEGKKSEKDRIAEEDKKRKSRESKLEAGGFKTLFSAVKKLMAPFQSIWDRIINFFVNVLLGKIALKLLDWFADPKNSDKIKSMIRFVKDWWPALLGGYILFGTSFGKAIRSILGIATKILPRIIGLIAANPLTSLAIGTAVVATAGAVTRVKESERLKPELDKQKAKVEDKDKDTSAPWYQKLGNYFAGSEISNVEKTQAFGTPTPGAMYSGGGYAGGLKNLFSRSKFDNKEKQKTFSGKVTGKGGPKEDKIPAMLSNGEFVMSAGAVRKWGVDKLEEMNAAGGGTNQPQFSSGVTRAAGGGLIGDSVPVYGPGIANPERFARTYGGRFGISEMEWKDSFKKFGGVPDIDKIYGKGTWQKMQMGWDIPEVGELQKLVKNAAFDDAAALSRARGNVRRYPTSKPSSTAPVPKETLKPRLGSNRMLPAAGESSANAMRAAEKAAKNIRQPIPASRAIVPYQGGGLSRSGVTAGLSESIPQIRTNMNVPGGRGGRGGMVGTIAITLAEIFKPQIQSVVGSLYNKMGIGLGNLSDVELKKQIQEELEIENGINSGPLGSINSQSERLTLLKQESERRNPTLKGGTIKGGYGLKDQSFKDAPKTSIITDDKGRPALGHKALKNGKLHYVRGPQPRVGTKNPLEMLGRMVNPDAYKENDARQTLNKQKVGLVDSLQSLQERGASTETQARMMKQMGSNLTDVQNDLDYRKTGRRKVNVSQNKFAKNQSKLEQKRPWWDKMGWMGGGSKVAQDEQLRSGEKKLGGGSVKLYNKPKPNTQTPYKSRFARPRNAGVGAPKPPGPRKPRVIVVNANTRRANSGRPAHTNTPKAPGFSSAHRRSSGRTVSGSTYGLGSRI